MNMTIKQVLVVAAILAAATSAFADGVTGFSKNAPVRGNIVANGMVQAPGPSLVYFSDASYPILPQSASTQTRAEVKADLIQAASK